MTHGIDPESEYWLSLARHVPLGILTDLDGTLLPFAPTPEEARPSPELTRLITDLSTLADTMLVIVSGRPRPTLDEFFPPPRSALIVAEHGAWRSRSDGWEPIVTTDARVVDSLAVELNRLQRAYPAAFLERKTWSVALHYRRVPSSEKTGLLVEAAAIIRLFTEANPDFELLNGAEVLEVRPRAARKANAVAWVRGMLGPTSRLLIVGDDVTDEDMFAAASPDDATVLVGKDQDRSTAARWQLDSIDDVHALYHWMASLRRQSERAPPSRHPSRVASLPNPITKAPYDLLVLSNRLPELRSAEGSERKKNVGGLVSALAPILARKKGIWLGWSGRTRPEATASELGFTTVGGLSLAWVDFPEAWHRHYYNGFSNSALWPLFHTFPGRLKLSHDDWRAYEAANEAFASVATRLIRPDATVWVHDYHLLLLGASLRARGHRGPVGLFQHIPFPGPDVLFLLPWAERILEAMLEFDLVGFHTQPYVDNFLRCMASVPGVRIEGSRAIRGDRSVVARSFPIGIIPEEFQESEGEVPSDEIAGLIRAIRPKRLVLGVDRLDYTKGIPERIVAFGRFLEFFPEWRRKACLVQVSVPSRGDIPEYAEQRSRVENIVGRVNGEYGEADWVPIRYLYRSYARGQLSQLYRAADVGYVTPLRDGMNLVAKEFVAAQDPKEPGVLLLSRFAGAAEELTAALLTNPWDTEGTARDLERALQMPREERVSRHQSLYEVISRTTALTWAEDFLGALAESVTARPSRT
jgi:alpha,alpha-trehalose-phosphate synthase [UDP-forming]/trehalose-phosphatase